MKKKFSFLVLLSAGMLLFAQTEHLSAFTTTSITYKFHPRFFIFAEGQLRSTDKFTYPDYYEIKGGLGYQITKNHKPFVGLGRYGTYKNHSFAKEEFRVWLQDVIDVNAGRLKFENRIRAEKSWFYEPLADQHAQRMRYRYRLNISAPLNAEKVKPGTLSANVYDELFFIPSEEPALARNRIYGGLSLQVANYVSVAGGYLLQREFAASGNKNLHFLYLGINFTLDQNDVKNNMEPHSD